jgi:DNA-binding PadR family transcriptional regulator
MGLGELEQVILLALVRLGGEAHGAGIAAVIEQETGRSVAPGGLYTVLERLQQKGYVEGWIGEGTPERGGRRRKVYRILPEGAEAVRSWYDGIRHLGEGVRARMDALAEGAG